jgi:hypothetical protein
MNAETDCVSIKLYCKTQPLAPFDPWAVTFATPALERET